jgi:isopentenyl diphosphate isomerase/L-lactate dehydrogenase-like FMN-dependent dehydrogenase
MPSTLNHEHRRLLLKFILGSPLLGFISCTTPREQEKLAEKIFDGIQHAGDALDVFDFEKLARHKLPTAHYGYLATGVDSDRTIQANRDAFDKVKLKMRRLIDPTQVDMSTTIFGRNWSSPIVLSPVSSQKAFHPDGELATARAAKAKDHLQILSTVTTTSVEDVTQERGMPVWYQLYALNDWNASKDMIKRAEDVGTEVMVFTVDLAAGSNRITLERAIKLDDRNCATCHTENRFEHKPMVPNTPGIDFEEKLTWDYVDKLKNTTKMKLVVKGIETAEDAQLCLDHGVDGIIISNHGGRASETGRGTLEALPEMAAVVNRRIPVLIDGGFRRGTDIFKALALGADAICIGRPYIWGLASFGQEGVEAVLQILRDELEMVMGQAGTRRISEINKSFIA